MARQVQIIKGTTAQNEAFTGAEGVLTYDSDKKDIRIHDGTTAGGFEIPSAAMADYVIYWDSGDATDHSHAKPGVTTPASGTWYRLYKSGWVEQGGIIANLTDKMARIVFPIIMADKNYTILAGQYVDSPNSHYWYVRQDINVDGVSIKASAGAVTAAYWQVSGMAA